MQDVIPSRGVRRTLSSIVAATALATQVLAQPLTIRGTVKLQDGRPADARVRVVSELPLRGRALDMLAGARPDGGPSPARWLYGGSEDDFLDVGPEGELEARVERPGPWWVVVEPSDGGPRHGLSLAGHTTDLELPELVIRPDRRRACTLRLESPDQAFLRGTRVPARFEGWIAWRPWRSLRQGENTVYLLADELTDAEIEVGAPGFEPRRVRCTAGKTAVVRLSRRATAVSTNQAEVLDGTVVVDQGGWPMTLSRESGSSVPAEGVLLGQGGASTPLADASVHQQIASVVTLLRTGSRKPVTGSFSVTRWSRSGDLLWWHSGEAGQFLLHTFDPDPASVLEVAAVGWETVRTTLAELQGSPSVDAIALTPWRRNGIVVEVGNGGPIPKAKIVARETGVPLERALGLVVETDSDGVFTLPELPWALLSVSAEAEGFVSQTLRRAERQEIAFRLERRGGIEGRVIDEEGHPLPAAVLVYRGGARKTRIVTEQLEPEGFLEIERAGEDGTFGITGLPLPRIDVAIVDADHATRWLESIDVAGTVRDLGDIYLDAGAAIRGTVRTEWDEPIAGAIVGVGRAVETRHFPFQPTAPTAYVVSGDAGDFAISGLSPHDLLDLEVQAEGFVARRLPRVRAGGPPVAVELERALTIRGWLVDEEGRPVRGRVEFRLPGESEPVTYAVADLSDGRFELHPVPSGRGEVIARAEAFETARVLLDTAASEEIEVTLRRGGARLEGTVLVRGVGVADAMVEVGVRGRQWTDERGMFLTELPTGIHRITIAAPGMAPLRRQVEIGPGENRESFELVEALLEGEALASGTPVEDAHVMLRSGSFQQHTRSDSSGRFVLKAPPGTYQLSVDAAGYSSWAESVTLPDEQAPYRVELEPGTELLVVVEGLNESELGQLEVRLSEHALAPGRRLERVSPNEFRLVGVDPGLYVVEGVLAYSGRSSREDVDVPAEAAMAEATLSFGAGTIVRGTVEVDGRLGAGQLVLLIDRERGDIRRTVADHEGDFQFSDVRGGGTSLSAAHRLVPLDGADNSEVRIEGRRVSLRGSVVAQESGSALVGVTVRVAPEPLSPEDAGLVLGGLEATTDETGRFELSLFDRPYLVELLIDGGLVDRRRVDLTGGSTGEMVVAVPSPFDR